MTVCYSILTQETCDAILTSLRKRTPLTVWERLLCEDSLDAQALLEDTCLKDIRLPGKYVFNLSFDLPEPSMI